MRKITIISQLVIFLTSCQFSNEGLKTLDVEVSRKWKENLQLLTQTVKLVDDAGNRPLDVAILKDSESVLELRQGYNLPELSDSVDNLDIQGTIEYVAELYKLASENEIEISVGINERINLLNKDHSIDKRLKKRMIYLNVLEIESAFFEDRLRKIGGACGRMCYSFNFMSESDTVPVGETHKSIVSIADKITDFPKCSLKNLGVTHNEQPIAIQYTSIGSSVYMQFEVEEVGRYVYSGELKCSYENTNTEYSCQFMFEIFGTK